MDHNNGEKAVFRLAQEKPKWIPIVEAALQVNQKIAGRDFAGKWVLDEAKQHGIDWIPNLRTLTAYGILKKEDTARGGRRAYYSMPDPEGIKKALSELTSKG